MGLSEKKTDAEYPPPTEEQRALTLVEDWSPEEEAKAKRKLDLIIMPLLTLGFFCLRMFFFVVNSYPYRTQRC